MIDSMKNRNMSVVREVVGDLKKANRSTRYKIIRDALEFIDRADDVTAVRDAMTNRFAVTIEESTGDDTTWVDRHYVYDGYERHIRPDAAARINAGLEPAINTGIATRIADSLATLFNQPTGYFRWSSTRAEEWISEQRRLGGFDMVMEAADFCACAVGSCAVHVFWRGDHLAYSTVAPHQIWVVYGNEILDNGIRRAVDYQDIDDASAVIIETASPMGADDKSFIAYFGSSVEYPNGRMVRYRAREYHNVPEPGDESAFDYERDGMLCNPLSYLRNADKSGMVRTEYPIGIILGGIRRMAGELMPTTTSLYEAGVELELAWSQCLKYGLAGMRGKDVIHLDATASSYQLPINLDMPVLSPGQKYEHLHGQVQADGHNMLQAIVAQTTSGFSVPSYMVLSEGNAPESGVALAIRTRPLMDARRRRIALNTDSVDKIFSIEACLAAENKGTAGMPISPDVEQTWDPGDWNPPTNPADRIDTIQKQEDAGYIDHIEAVRRANSLATIDEALELIEQQTEREKQLKDEGLYGAQQEAASKPPFGGMFGQ